jgi:hypothetical protein
MTGTWRPSRVVQEFGVAHDVQMCPPGPVLVQDDRIASRAPYRMGADQGTDKRETSEMRPCSSQPAHPHRSCCRGYPHEVDSGPRHQPSFPRRPLPARRQ